MPYPIATLPYPFRRRLRQLLTPAEACQLQIATGSLDHNKDLLPLQAYYSVYRYCIQKLNATTIEFKYCIKGGDEVHTDDSLHSLSSIRFHLEGLDETDISRIVFHNVLKCSFLTISNCTITADFLTNLSQKQLKPDRLAISKCSIQPFLESATKISHLFETFPSVERCWFEYFTISGWLGHLLDYGKTNLKDLYISANDFDKLFSFEPKELCQLFKAQNDDFRLHMLYKGSSLNGDENIPSIEAKILPLLEPYFKVSSTESSYSIMLTFMCEHEGHLQFGAPTQHLFSLR